MLINSPNLAILQFVSIHKGLCSPHICYKQDLEYSLGHFYFPKKKDEGSFIKDVQALGERGSCEVGKTWIWEEGRGTAIEGVRGGVPHPQTFSFSTNLQSTLGREENFLCWQIWTSEI